jgi:hypothetical protein
MGSSDRVPLIAALVSLSCLGGSVALRIVWVDPLASDREDYAIAKEALPSPGPRVLDLMSLEHPQLLADLLWLQIVQILAEPTVDAAVVDRLVRWTELATDVDPGYYVVYYAGGIHLAVYAGRPDASDGLLRKGRRSIPDRWELPYLLGYNAYFMHGDPKGAAALWLESSKLPKVPFFVPSLIARSTYQSGAKEEAEHFLEVMIANTPDGPHRNDAITRLAILRSDPILTEYDQACVQIKLAEGRQPTPKEIFERGLTRHEPFDLLGKEIYLDRNCRARTELIAVREDEAAQRVGIFKRNTTQSLKIEVRGDDE